MTDRRQAIIWTNEGLIWWRICESLGLNDKFLFNFKRSQFLTPNDSKPDVVIQSTEKYLFYQSTIEICIWSSSWVALRLVRIMCAEIPKVCMNFSIWHFMTKCLEGTFCILLQTSLRRVPRSPTGDEYAPNHHLDQRWTDLFTNLCVTRLQWMIFSQRFFPAFGRKHF